MIGNQIALAVYALFLLVILGINLLYIFQIFKYRLPGDASIAILVIQVGLIVSILIISSVYLSFT